MKKCGQALQPEEETAKLTKGVYSHAFVCGHFKMKYIWQLRLKEGACKEKFEAGKQWVPVHILRDNDWP